MNLIFPNLFLWIFIFDDLDNVAHFQRQLVIIFRLIPETNKKTLFRIDSTRAQKVRVISCLSYL